MAMNQAFYGYESGIFYHGDLKTKSLAKKKIMVWQWCLFWGRFSYSENDWNVYIADIVY